MLQVAPLLHSSSFSDKTKKNEKEQTTNERPTSGQVVTDEDEETFFSKIKKKIFG